MKKVLIYPIGTYELDDFNSRKSEKNDYAYVILAITRKIISMDMLVAKDLNLIEKPFLVVKIDKVSRAYVFIAHNKYFSIYFPFQIKVDGLSAKVYSTKSNLSINNFMISEAFGLIHDIRANDSIIDAFLDSDVSQATLNMLELIYLAEPCYLRYDYDKETSKGKPTLHPARHLDVNFSKSGTYKLGLYQNLTCEQFMDIVDISSSCSFLSKYVNYKEMNEKWKKCKHRHKKK